MLDFLVLFLVGRHIASIAKRKNRNPVGYVLLLVFSYLGLAFVFGMIAGAIAVANGAGEDVAMPVLALGCLVAIAMAIPLSYIVVCSVPPLKKHRYDDYDDYDDEPSGRSRYEDDDDYDRPRSRRRDDEDDYRPRRGPREDYE